MSIELLIFDLGKVLLEFEHMEICRRLSRFSLHSSEAIHGMVFQNGAEDLLNTGRLSPREFFSRLSQALTLSLDFETFKLLWADIFSEKVEVTSLLPLLRPRHRLLLLSNTNPLHFELICCRFPGVIAQFDYLLPSYEAGCQKPDPRIYHLALERGQCDPQRCLYIDDNAQFVEAARQLHIPGITYQSPEQLRRELAAHGIAIA